MRYGFDNQILNICKAKCNCNMKRANNTEILLTQIRKMQHIANNKKAPTEATINRRKSNINAKK